MHLVTSHVATSFPSSASITAAKRVHSVLTVGLNSNSQVIHSLREVPFAQHCTLIEPSLFSMIKFKHSNALFLSANVSASFPICFKPFLTWSCFVSFTANCPVSYFLYSLLSVDDHISMAISSLNWHIILNPCFGIWLLLCYCPLNTRNSAVGLDTLSNLLGSFWWSLMLMFLFFVSTFTCALI